MQEDRSAGEVEPRNTPANSAIDAAWNGLEQILAALTKNPGDAGIADVQAGARRKRGRGERRALTPDEVVQKCREAKRLERELRQLLDRDRLNGALLHRSRAMPIARARRSRSSPGRRHGSRRITARESARSGDPPDDGDGESDPHSGLAAYRTGQGVSP